VLGRVAVIEEEERERGKKEEKKDRSIMLRQRHNDNNDNTDTRRSVHKLHTPTKRLKRKKRPTKRRIGTNWLCHFSSQFLLIHTSSLFWLSRTKRAISLGSFASKKVLVCWAEEE
jgi:hypothetical protein